MVKGVAIRNDEDYNNPGVGISIAYIRAQRALKRNPYSLNRYFTNKELIHRTCESSNYHEHPGLRSLVKSAIFSTNDILFYLTQEEVDWVKKQ